MKAKAKPVLAHPSISQDGVNNADFHPAPCSPTMSKRNSEDANKYFVRTMEEPVGISPVLSNALEHIVEQLDVLTLVSVE